MCCGSRQASWHVPSSALGNVLGIYGRPPFTGPLSAPCRRRIGCTRCCRGSRAILPSTNVSDSKMAAALKEMLLTGNLLAIFTSTERPRNLIDSSSPRAVLHSVRSSKPIITKPRCAMPGVSLSRQKKVAVCGWLNFPRTNASNSARDAWKWIFLATMRRRLLRWVRSWFSYSSLYGILLIYFALLLGAQSRRGSGNIVREPTLVFQECLDV